MEIEKSDLLYFFFFCAALCFCAGDLRSEEIDLWWELPLEISDQEIEKIHKSEEDGEEGSEESNELRESMVFQKEENAQSNGELHFETLSSVSSKAALDTREKFRFRTANLRKGFGFGSVFVNDRSLNLNSNSQDRFPDRIRQWQWLKGYLSYDRAGSQVYLGHYRIRFWENSDNNGSGIFFADERMTSLKTFNPFSAGKRGLPLRGLGTTLQIHNFQSSGFYSDSASADNLTNGKQAGTHLLGILLG
ncbi:MAG: hypothetical protein HYY07_03200, partial [Elusimicrobia bacterium]|nr:hypothetical protein [Elusimicrobiota bacterium]